MAFSCFDRKQKRINLLKLAYFFNRDLERILEMVCPNSLLSLFFNLLFGCPTAKFGLLLRGQPKSSDVREEPGNEIGCLSSTKRLVEFDLGLSRFDLSALTHRVTLPSHPLFTHRCLLQEITLEKDKYIKKTC